MLGCTIYGIREGDVPKMMAPYDKNIRFCGIKIGNDSSYVAYPKLYFHNLEAPANKNFANSLFSNAYCVKKCPKAVDETLEAAGGNSLKAVSKTNEILNFCIPTGMNSNQTNSFK